MGLYAQNIPKGTLYALCHLLIGDMRSRRAQVTLLDHTWLQGRAKTLAVREYKHISNFPYIHHQPEMGDDWVAVAMVLWRRAGSGWRLRATSVEETELLPCRIGRMHATYTEDQEFKKNPPKTPSQVKPMTYQIETCRYVAWLSALIGYGKDSFSHPICSKEYYDNGTEWDIGSLWLVALVSQH